MNIQNQLNVTKYNEELVMFQGHMFIIILFENAQGVDFQPCRAQNFACWNNATSC
jgi:hypothetical protein